MKNLNFTTGKLIVSGEHSVVYGEPAVVASVSLGVKTKARFEAGEKLVLIQGKKRNVMDEERVRKLQQQAGLVYEQFLETGSGEKLVQIRSLRQNVVPWLAFGVVAEKFGLFTKAWEIEIDSEIPNGSGMGSSAAVAAGVMKAVLKAGEVEVKQDELNQMVYEVEKLVHGKPSGVDNTAVVFGGLIEFRKIDEVFEWKRVEAKKRLPEMVLIQSGKPVESTGEMVAGVRQRYEASAKFRTIIGEMGALTRKVVESLEEGRWPKKLINENEKYMEEIGVVGERAKEMVEEIREIGGAAKVCGAGGVDKGSGIILGVHDSLEELEQLVSESSWKYWRVTLG